MATPTGACNAEKPTAFSGFLRYFYGNFIVLILGFISVPLITRVMSAEEYGRSGMFVSAVTVIYIFAILGMDQTYIRYYYKDGIDRVRLLKRCLFPALFIVSILSLLYVIFSSYANDFLFGKTGMDISILVIGYTIISVFERFLFLDIRMSQNGKLYSNLNILSKVLYIALIFVAFYFLGDDFRVVLIAMTLSLGIVTGGIGVRYIIKNAKSDKSSAIQPSQRELVSYGMPFILVLLMEWLLSSCDRWSLRIWSGYAELGIYSSAMNIMSILLTFKATFVAFWSPVAMEKYEKGSEEENIAFFKGAFNITRMLCVLGAFGLILFRKVIVFILGSDYRDAAAIIPFLTLMPIFSIMFEITNQGIKFVKKNRYLNYASAVAIVCNLCGNAILVPKFGGAGAAVATGITYVAFFAIGSFFSEKCYPVGYDTKKTLIYAIMLFVYAYVATFTDNGLVDVLTGMAGIVIVCAFDFKVLALCINYVMKLFLKNK